VLSMDGLVWGFQRGDDGRSVAGRWDEKDGAGGGGERAEIAALTTSRHVRSGLLPAGLKRASECIKGADIDWLNTRRLSGVADFVADLLLSLHSLDYWQTLLARSSGVAGPGTSVAAHQHIPSFQHTASILRFLSRRRGCMLFSVLIGLVSSLRDCSNQFVAMSRLDHPMKHTEGNGWRLRYRTGVDGRWSIVDHCIVRPSWPTDTQGWVMQHQLHLCNKLPNSRHALHLLHPRYNVCFQCRCRVLCKRRFTRGRGGSPPSAALRA
jgi:hypothetical protein